jgi:uncharacterized protein YcgL (UPF0745 family)
VSIKIIEQFGAICLLNVCFIKLNIKASEDKLFVKKNNILKRVTILHESIPKMHGEVPNESLILALDDEKKLNKVLKFVLATKV